MIGTDDVSVMALPGAAHTPETPATARTTTDTDHLSLSHAAGGRFFALSVERKHDEFIKARHHSGRDALRAAYDRCASI
jgi:hypothetical protein